MKKIRLISLLSIVFSSLLFTQTEEPPPYTGEIKIGNSSSTRTIYIKVYPVSMIFNGRYFYDLHTMYPDNIGYEQYRYMTGVSLINGIPQTLRDIPPNTYKSFHFELDGQGDGANGILGFGVYKFEFYWDNALQDTCLVEYDAEPLPVNDLLFNFKQDALGTNPRIEYEWADVTCQPRTIQAAGRYLKRWEPDWCNNPPIYNRNKNYGNFLYTTDPNNTYDILPQDFRQDCGYESNGDAALIYLQSPGLLKYNLTINKDIESRTLANSEAPGLLGTPTYTIMSPQCTLTIDNNKIYTVKYDEYYTYDQTYYSIIFVKENAWLWLKSNSQLIFENTSIFRGDCYSHLYMESGAKLIMQQGSKMCFKGSVNGSGRIVIEGPVKRLNCPNNCADTYINDSTIIEVQNGAGFELPDSTTYVFSGSQTALVCKDSSEIKFGKGSKLVFQDGARISANGCKFISYDSTDIWDGIYLDGIAYDTLKNCTFQNAVNGINITDNYNPFGSPGAVEISNCTFKNSTSSDLLNYVYVNNSYNVLIEGCNSEKTGSGGFTAGIIAEYCPTNGVVIADNNINYVTTGISLLQSSEYIGRNTIIGSSNSGTGIYLDNSNGTIEYNTVNNFQKSVYGSYSSPYMLKNTLSNASVKNIDLASNSYPVMKPVVSGSTLRWLGGNNTITGTPSNSGIAFSDCYPLMDSGYNRITVNGSDYMNGNFTFSYTTVNAKINYWYDNPPQSTLFDVSGGSINYSYPFDGSTLPSTDGTELNSLGWGLYDTVFTKSFGDNSTPEDLFIQAYTEEMSQNYNDAITHYKEVVISYKTSSFAPVSLSRIFNCLEKSHANVSDYQAIQSYYNSIKSNSAYPNESRELAEDFVIKSKVKQGNVEDAVNDYNAIYQSNQNNSKGLHALINKYCLENMVQGDNSSGNTNYQDYKMNILSLITGENIKTNIFSNNNSPKQFRLLQNYPNPFNPVTNIKYEIPNDVNVSIKIYDILGREVFSFNEYKLAGSYEVQFDGSNFASGMYFYKLKTDGFTDTKKMVLLK